MTGHGGPKQTLSSGRACAQVTVTFNADVSDGMNWRFKPTQRAVKVRLPAPQSWQGGRSGWLQAEQSGERCACKSRGRAGRSCIRAASRPCLEACAAAPGPSNRASARTPRDTGSPSGTASSRRLLHGCRRPTPRGARRAAGAAGAEHARVLHRAQPERPCRDGRVNIQRGAAAGRAVLQQDPVLLL